MKHIYLVTGFTGRYETSTTWTVRAFAKKEQAELFMAKLTMLYNTLPDASERQRLTWEEHHVEDVMRVLDKKFVEYDGYVAYDVSKVPFGDIPCAITSTS
jgi:hypothetical protein